MRQKVSSKKVQEKARLNHTFDKMICWNATYKEA